MLGDHLKKNNKNAKQNPEEHNIKQDSVLEKFGGRGMEALWLAHSVFIKSKGIDGLLSPVDISWQSWQIHRKDAHSQPVEASLPFSHPSLHFSTKLTVVCWMVFQ